MINFSPNERREFERKPLTVQIEYEGNAATGTATTRDIGLGGLYMKTDARLPVHTQLKLRFPLGEHDMNIFGVVAYSDESGVGVRFQNLGSEIEAILKQELPAIESAEIKIRK